MSATAAPKRRSLVDFLEADDLVRKIIHLRRQLPDASPEERLTLELTIEAIEGEILERWQNLAMDTYRKMLAETDPDFDPPAPPAACLDMPKSDAKIKVLSQRAAAGEELFDGRDLTWEDSPCAILGRLGSRGRNGNAKPQEFTLSIADDEDEPDSRASVLADLYARRAA